MNREELINQVKALVDTETAEELEYLRKENERLIEENNLYATYKTERARILAENNQLKCAKDMAYNRGVEDTKKARLESLLDLEYGYTITKEVKYKYPKCDKCDDNRKLHFKSPLGRDFEELCSCSEKEFSYIVDSAQISSFVFDYQGRGDFNNKPSRYYKSSSLTADHQYDRNENRIWVYNNMTDITNVIDKQKPQYWNYVFSNKEDAQRFADKLNKEAAEDNEN